MNKINSLLLSASAAILLVACSDNIAEVQESSYTVAPELDKKLSKKACGPGNAGALLFAASSPQNLVCDGNDWIPWTRPNSDQKLGEPKITCAEGSYDPSRQMCDSRDGQVYSIVQIGEQTWMAENLNYDLEALPDGTPRSTVSSMCHGDKSDDCKKYGRLYTWAGAIDSVALANDPENPQTCGNDKICDFPKNFQGICPDGWHLPDTTEWMTLSATVGGTKFAGLALKSQTGWTPHDGIPASADAYGFSAVPNEFEVSSETNGIIGNSVTYWVPTDCNRQYIFCIYLRFDNNATILTLTNKVWPRSVRCVKD